MALRRVFGSIPDPKSGNMIKKFYQHAGVKHTSEGYGVVVDGRNVKTPERQPVVLPSEILALTVASEWEAQEEYIKPHTMPMVITK